MRRRTFQTIGAVRCVVYPGQFPPGTIIDEHASSGITDRQLRFIDPGSGVKCGREQLAHARGPGGALEDIAIDDVGHLVFPPPHQPIENTPFPAAESGSADPNLLGGGGAGEPHFRATLCAAPEHDEVPPLFVCSVIELGVDRKGSVDLPEPQVAASVVEVGRRRINGALEDKGRSNGPADMLRAQETARTYGGAEKPPQNPCKSQPLPESRLVGALVL